MALMDSSIELFSLKYRFPFMLIFDVFHIMPKTNQHSDVNENLFSPDYIWELEKAYDA